MKKDFKEFIKQLSLSDPKTLSQKALKTSEEVGELAKAVLLFEFEKVEIEYSIYDTNVSHDTKWINS